MRKGGFPPGCSTSLREPFTEPRTIFGALKASGILYFTRKESTGPRSCETMPSMALPFESTSGDSKRMPYLRSSGMSVTQIFSAPTHSAQASAMR